MEEVCSGFSELHLARFGIPESAAALGVFAALHRCVISSEEGGSGSKRLGSETLIGLCEEVRVFLEGWRGFNGLD